MTLLEFLNMGGYAFYVWTSYGIALALLLANLIAPIYHRRRLLADMSRRLRRSRADAPARPITPPKNES